MRFQTILSLILISSAVPASAAELTGVVLQQNGEPAAGATVTAAAVFVSPPWRLTTVADDRGLFRIELPVVKDHAHYNLAIRWNSQGYVVKDTMDSNLKRVQLRGQSLPMLTARLSEQGRLTVKLRQMEDGKPIAGGKLFFDTGELLVTDSEGNCLIDGLEMDDHSLIPVVQGRVRGYVLFDTTLTPAAELEIRLKPAMSLKGSVVDKDGQPVPGAYCTRRVSGNGLTLNGYDEGCEVDGSFEYHGIPSDRRITTLEMAAPGFKSQSLTIMPNQEEDNFQRTITLTKDSKIPSDLLKSNPLDLLQLKSPSQQQTPEPLRKSVSGVVRDGEGNAVAGASVRWGTFMWDDSVEPVTTDNAGRYQLKSVPSSKNALIVVAKGHAPIFMTVKENETEVNVQLSRGVTYRGKVVGSNGDPVKGAQVMPVTTCPQTGYCNPIWFKERAAETDDKGEFVIDFMQRDGFQFDILKKGFTEQRNLHLKSGTLQNKIQLSAGGAVWGTVVDPKGRPVRQFNVRVRIPRQRTPDQNSGGFFAGFDSIGISFTRDDGQFVLSDVPAGSWVRLVVTSPEIGKAIIEPVQCRPIDMHGTLEGTKIELQPYTPFRVRVVDVETHEPIAGATVGFLPDRQMNASGFRWGYDDLSAECRTSDQSGEVQYLEPRGDDGILFVIAPGYATHRIEWSAEDQPVILSLQREAQLEGTVRVNGKPLNEGFVRLHLTSGDNYGLELNNAAGKVHISGLKPGLHEIEVHNTSGSRIHSTTVQLNAGRLNQLTLDIQAQEK